MSNLPKRAKWALLIGINAYPKLKKKHQLNGCVNDVRAMARILEAGFGFKKEHISILTDEAATRRGILEGMEALLGRVGEDDIVVLHYSGHGSQTPDIDGDEADGFDETIVPHDSGRGQEVNRDITDDEIGLWLQRMAAKSPYVTLIFDCCHSGTIDRSFGAKERWIERGTYIPRSESTTLLDVPAKGPSNQKPADMQHVLMVGCKAHERSYEYSGPDGTTPHGRMTYILLQALGQATPGMSYQELFEQVRQFIASRSSVEYPQHPQIEGPVGREVFGVAEIER